MRINERSNLNVTPQKTEEKTAEPSLLNLLPKITSSMLDQFETAREDLFQTRQSSSNEPAQEKQMMQADYQILERNRLKARFDGEQATAKIQAQKAAGSGSKIAGDKQNVHDGYEETYGANPKKNSFTEKELSNINGVINWTRGYTLWDKERVVWRALEFNESAEREKVGKGTAAGRLDVLNSRGRVFGEADLDWKQMVAKLGLGIQGAIEVVGAHVELKHDAPAVNLAGIDAALHTVINGDAYVGIVAQGEAVLNINLKDLTNGTYLRLGGEAFVGAAASASGVVSLGKLVSVDAQADAYAGAGAKGLIDVGFEKGEFGVHSGAGLAVGYGAGFEWGFKVNVGEIGKLAENAGKNLVDDPLNYPGEFGLEIGHVLGSNLGVALHFVDEVFHLTQDSGDEPIPSESSRSSKSDADRYFEAKKSGNLKSQS